MPLPPTQTAGQLGPAKSSHEDDFGLKGAPVAPSEAKDALIGEAEARTTEANLRADRADSRTDKAHILIDEANSRTQEADLRTAQADSRTETVEKQTESLRVSELGYRRLFESARDGILILDAESGRIDDANPFLVELLGFSLDEMIGKTVAELSPFRDIEANQSMLQRLQKDGYVRYEDLPLETRDGRRIAVEFVSNVYQTSGKKVIQCNIRDITERKRSVEQIIHQNAILMTQQETSLDGILMVDEHGRIASFNHQFLAMWGLPAILTASCEDEPTRQLVASKMANPEEFLARIQHLYEHKTEKSREEILLKDGRVFDRYSAPAYSPEGRYYGRVWFFRDITERKHLEDSNNRLAMAVEQSAETIVITDTRGTIVYINPAFEKTTGYTQEEAMGKNPRILKSGRQDVHFYKRMWETLGRGEVWNGHFFNQRKDGSLYEEEATISPLRNKFGATINYVATKRDVTREKQLEAQFLQSQKLESIGQLAGGVAHDFNNILAVMMMQTELAEKVEDTPVEVREALAGIRAAAGRAANLTRQLLLFGRRHVIQSSLFDLNELVTSLAKMLRRIIGEHMHLDLHLQSAPLLTGVIECVGQQNEFSRIFLALFSKSSSN